MKPIQWDELPQVSISGLHLKEGECRLLDAYVAQREIEGELVQFYEVADLLQCDFQEVQELPQHSEAEVAGSALGGFIGGAILGALVGGKAGAEIGAHLGGIGGAYDASSKRVHHFIVIHPEGYQFFLSTEQTTTQRYIFPILNKAWKRSYSINKINRELKFIHDKKIADARRAAKIFWILVLIMVVVVIILSIFSS